MPMYVSQVSNNTRSILATSGCLKAKSRIAPRFSNALVLVRYRSGSLNQRPNALGAEHLAHLFPIFIHCNSLKVRFEGAWCRLFRPGAISSEGGFLTAMGAFSHNSTSLLLYDLQMSDIIG